MKSFFFLIPTWIHLSKALLLPFNTSILRLPSQNTIQATGEVDTNKSLTTSLWPPLPYERYIKNGLSINITAYGDPLSKDESNKALSAVLSIQRTLQKAGKPNDVLDEITVLGVYSGNVYTEIGFYSLRPPAGMQRRQAHDALQFMWQLMVEFFPAREIALSKISSERRELALFRLSLRIG